MQDYKSFFKIFKTKFDGRPLVYLDSGATTQIATPVLDAIMEYETTKRANVHRGVHHLGDLSTQAYDDARVRVAKFVNAHTPSEIVFTKNSTDGLNIIALAYVKHHLKRGDIILVGEAEHHSNLLQWQELARTYKLKINYIPITKDGALDYKNVDTDWSKVRFVTVQHVSNVLGYLNDIDQIVKYVKRKAIQSSSLELPKFCVDASQSIAHIPINVQKMGVDFLVFSGHKMYGPMGIGVLWVNRNLHDILSPAFYGGGMVRQVNSKKNKYAQMPDLLEAGTPNVSGAYGLASAIDFIDKIGFEQIKQHDSEILTYAMSSLNQIGAEIYGPKDMNHRVGLISFNIPNIPSHDLASIASTNGVCIRSGQHCVMPWHIKNNIKTSARLSIGVYNSKSDIDVLIDSVNQARQILRY